MTPSIAVVIVTYRRPAILRSSLVHWAASRRRPDQLVIVDASPDAAQEAELVPALAPELFAARGSAYLVSDDPSTSRQRNLAIDRLTTDVVVFADDETEPDPHYLDRLAEVYERDPGGRIGGVGGLEFEQLTLRWRTGRLLADAGRPIARRIPLPRPDHREFRAYAGDAFAGLPVHAERALYGNRMSFRTALVREHRFDDRMHRYGFLEDLDISVRIAGEHLLVCRDDALIGHVPASVGRIASTARFLVSFVNPAYLVAKLYPGRPGAGRPLDRLVALSEVRDVVAAGRDSVARARVRERHAVARRMIRFLRDAPAPELADRFSILQEWLFRSGLDDDHLGRLDALEAGLRASLIAPHPGPAAERATS
jgi:GT2 family glycosyltransferase